MNKEIDKAELKKDIERIRTRIKIAHGDNKILLEYKLYLLLKQI